jgi:hypothetical protein
VLGVASPGLGRALCVDGGRDLSHGLSYERPKTTESRYTSGICKYRHGDSNSGLEAVRPQFWHSKADRSTAVNRHEPLVSGA